MKQKIIRLHKHDLEACTMWQEKDGIAFQHLVSACVEAYIKREPDVLRIVEDWKKINLTRWGREEQNKFDFSDRERRALLDEIGDFNDAVDSDDD